MVVGAAHTVVHSVFQAARKVVKTHAHAHLQEHVDDAGVLAHRAVANGAHLAVGQYLSDGILGCCALLAFIRTGQVLDVVGRMVIADVLQGGSYRFNEIGLFDLSHCVWGGVRKT